MSVVMIRCPETGEESLPASIPTAVRSVTAACRLALAVSRLRQSTRLDERIVPWLNGHATAPAIRRSTYGRHSSLVEAISIAPAPAHHGLPAPQR